MASAPQSELGPQVPQRWRVYDKARQLAHLAQIASEYATEGSRCDLAKAESTFDRMRAVLGMPTIEEAGS